MTKKCHIIKNMPNKKKNKKKIFLLLLRTECISLYHCVWYHYFWYQMKDKLICDKAKKKIQIKIIIQSKNIPFFVKGTKSGKFHKPQ